MADADYGYVWCGCGHVSLYRGKECIRKNIPQSEAIEALVSFLNEEGYGRSLDRHDSIFLVLRRRNSGAVML